MFRKPDVLLLGRSGDIRGLIKALGYRKDESAQVGAAKALGDTGDQRAIGPLAAWVRQARYHDDRVAAIGSIGKIGGPAAVDALLGLLADPPGPVPSRAMSAVKGTPGLSVRLDVAKALGETGDPRAVGPLAALVRPYRTLDEPGVALRSIGKIGGPAAVDVLLDLFTHPPEPGFAAKDDPAARARGDESVRAGAAWALGEAADQRAIGPLKAWVCELSDPQSRHLRFLSQQTRSADREIGIGRIGKIGGPAAADALLELFANPPGDAAGGLLAAEAVRVSAAKALGEAGDQRAIGPLKTWLYQTGSDEDRAVATGSIGQIGGPAAVGLLLELLPDARFGDSAAAALGSTGDPQAVTALLQLLTGSSVRLQSVAIALGRLGDSRAVTPLCELLSEKLKAGDNTDMSSIAVALGELGDRHAVPVLCEMLELANAGLADDGYGQGAHDRLMRAVEALERIGDQSALPALRQVSAGTVRPTERQLKMARHGDFDAGYEFLQRRETRYLALNQAIATLSGR